MDYGLWIRIMNCEYRILGYKILEGKFIIPGTENQFPFIIHNP